MFRSAAELTTSITNIFILLMSLYAYVKLKNKCNGDYKRFFFLMIFASLMGVIIHGINFSDKVTNILWLFLLILFAILINTLLTITLKDIKINKDKVKKINILLTIVLYISLFIMAILDIDFIIYFSLYSVLVIAFMLFVNTKKYIKDKKRIYIILGIVFQIIGGIFLLNRNLSTTIIVPIDKNGIYHFFMVLTVYMFYLYNKKIN